MALGKLGDFWEWNVFLQNLNLVNIRDQITMVFNFFWFRWYLLTQSTIGRRTIWNRVVRLRLGHEGLLSATTAHMPSAYSCLHARRQLLPMCLLLLRCQPPTAAHVPAVHCCVRACHCSCTCYLPPAASTSPLPPLPLVLLLFRHRLLSPSPPSFFLFRTFQCTMYQYSARKGPDSYWSSHGPRWVWYSKLKTLHILFLFIIN